jgi:uncharacterized iron-regulated membrane protein
MPMETSQERQSSAILTVTSAKKPRHWFVQIHRWLGLVIGIFIAIMGLTGSAIVFMQPLDRQLHPALMQVVPQGQRQPLDRIAAPVARVHPDLNINWIKFPPTDRDAMMVAMETSSGQRLETYVDPYTAKVLGERIWERSPIGFAHTVHHDLLMGSVGIWVVGGVGIVMLVVSLSGVVLWTGWRRLKSGVTVRWHVPRLRNFDLHNVVGFGSGALLMLLAVTGVAIVAFHIILEPPHHAAAPPATRALPDLQALVNTANRALPDGKISALEFAEDRQSVTIRKKMPDQQTGIFDLSTIEIETATGKVISAAKVIEAPPLFQVILAVVALHYGTVGGLTTQILYVAIGLMPLVLLVTGYSMWRQRQQKSRLTV